MEAMVIPDTVEFTGETESPDRAIVCAFAVRICSKDTMIIEFYGRRWSQMVLMGSHLMQVYDNCHNAVYMYCWLQDICTTT